MGIETLPQSKFAIQKYESTADRIAVDSLPVTETRPSQRLSKEHRAGRALEAHLIMRTIAERAILARSATAKRNRRLACQVPLFAIRIRQHNMAFHPQRTVGTNCNLYCFF
jgi:hypothetical protein